VYNFAVNNLKFLNLNSWKSS